jgi:hypothetical protein
MIRQLPRLSRRHRVRWPWSPHLGRAEHEPPGGAIGIGGAHEGRAHQKPVDRVPQPADVAMGANPRLRDEERGRRRERGQRGCRVEIDVQRRQVPVVDPDDRRA